MFSSFSHHFVIQCRCIAYKIAYTAWLLQRVSDKCIIYSLGFDTFSCVEVRPRLLWTTVQQWVSHHLCYAKIDIGLCPCVGTRGCVEIGLYKVKSSPPQARSKVLQLTKQLEQDGLLKHLRLLHHQLIRFWTAESLPTHVNNMYKERSSGSVRPINFSNGVGP